MYIYLKKNVKSRIYSLDKEIKVKKKKKIIIHIQTISANSHVKKYFKSYNIKYFSKIKNKNSS